MYLYNKQTQDKEKITIIPATVADLRKADKSGRFEFKWMAEGKKEVYKLQLEANGEILGLMAVEDIPQEIRIEISVLEASKENVGQDKIYEGIAGSLIAFACRMASLNGYGGFISLTPKTVLREHYKEIYGFIEMGNKVCSFDENSERLIKKYLGGQ